MLALHIPSGKASGWNMAKQGIICIVSLVLDMLDYKSLHRLEVFHKSDGFGLVTELERRLVGVNKG